MAGGGGLAALEAAWGIEILDSGREELEAGAESLSQKHIEEYLLDTDIRKFGLASKLPKELARGGLKELPPGKYFVQVSKFADVTQPSKFQEDFEGGKWRLLALDLTDGEQKFRGIEYGAVKDLGVHLPPGTKLLLSSAPGAVLRIGNGHLLLEPRCVRVLGGNVDKLVENWRASKQVEEKRLLWRTEGIKKADGEGAPPWIDFDPKKARGGARKALEEDYAEWRKAGHAEAGGPQPKTAERENARFNVQDFAGEEGQSSAPVRGQVNCSAFAQAQSNGRKGGGKGKEGGGKGKEGGGGGKGSRRGRDDDWDGGEEKRAPQAANTLAAFIKPTKKGELPDETLAALAEPEPAAASAGWSGSGGGWDDGWEAGGGGWGQGWGGGGWQGGGGGGGKGQRRKGGGGKGGGKGGGGRKGGKGW